MNAVWVVQHLKTLFPSLQSESHTAMTGNGLCASESCHRILKSLSKLSCIHRTLTCNPGEKPLSDSLKKSHFHRKRGWFALPFSGPCMMLNFSAAVTVRENTLLELNDGIIFLFHKGSLALSG